MIIEKPILFSGSMVGALLQDQKTVTRRILKVQPSRKGLFLTQQAEGPEKKNDGKYHWCELSDDKLSILHDDGEFFSFGYEKGNHLWVRENFQINLSLIHI